MSRGRTYYRRDRRAYSKSAAIVNDMNLPKARRIYRGGQRLN